MSVEILQLYLFVCKMIRKYLNHIYRNEWLAIKVRKTSRHHVPVLYSVHTFYAFLVPFYATSILYQTKLSGVLRVKCYLN